MVALRTRLLGLWRLFRFELPFAAGVCVILGALLALGKLPSISQMLLGFLSVFTISASSLVLNDYFDIESDKINVPGRPLPSGLVKPRDAVLFFIGLTLFGFITGYLISPTAFVVVAFVWAVGFLYNWRFKKAGFLGNLMVSFSVGMTFVYGGIVVGKPFEKIVWFFAILALLIDLGEEIAGDAMDLEGDSRAGSRSLAVLLGRERALKISGAIFLLVILISGLPFLFGWFNWLYLIPILVMDAVILYSTIRLLDSRIENRRKYMRWIYLSGSAAMLALIIIRLIQ